MAAEGWIPPGWTVEVKVKNNGKRYKCYTDPSNGLKFYSKPEVLRFLNKPGINQSKSPVVEGGKIIAESGTNEQIIRSQSSKLVGVVKDEKTLESCTGREATSVSSFNLSEATNLEQREEKNDPVTSVLVPPPIIEALPEKLSENEVQIPENCKMQPGLNKSNNQKKKPQLPLRASKRLAGIEIGPIPELKTNKRARTTRQSDKDGDRRAGNVGDSVAPEEPAVQVETNNKVDVKSSLKDLWMDPCIEFAIKTLMGVIPIEEENKTDDKKSSLELPSRNSWEDPCFEFAVKTLTGAIPMVDDFGNQGCFQQQLTSTETTKER